jgi:hypothetical protein
VSVTSSANGQIETISSRRRRRFVHPTGRGFEPNSARMLAISLWSIAFSPIALYSGVLSVITLKARAEAAVRERPAQVFVLVALPGRPGDRELA